MLDTQLGLVIIGVLPEGHNSHIAGGGIFILDGLPDYPLLPPAPLIPSVPFVARPITVPGTRLTALVPTKTTCTAAKLFFSQQPIPLRWS
jgi:hypothetical protein